MTSQLSFLPDASLSPAGLQYQRDFISEREEHDLVQRIRSLPLQPFQFGAFEGKRRVACCSGTAHAIALSPLPAAHGQRTLPDHQPDGTCRRIERM